MIRKILSKIKNIFLILNSEITQVNKGLRYIRENGGGSRCPYF